MVEAADFAMNTRSKVLGEAAFPLPPTVRTCEVRRWRRFTADEA
jgi:hypothetical protein